MEGYRSEIAVSGKLWFIVGLYVSEHFQNRTKELDLIETKNRCQLLTRNCDKVTSDPDNAMRYEFVSFDVGYLMTLSASNSELVGIWEEATMT
jgi:hypothetical protein